MIGLECYTGRYAIHAEVERLRTSRTMNGAWLLRLISVRPSTSGSAPRSVHRTVASTLESDAPAQAWAGMRDASAALTTEPAGALLEKAAPAHDRAVTLLFSVALTEEVPRLAHAWAGPAHSWARRPPSWARRSPRRDSRAHYWARRPRSWAHRPQAWAAQPLLKDLQAQDWAGRPQAWARRAQEWAGAAQRWARSSPLVKLRRHSVRETPTRKA